MISEIVNYITLLGIAYYYIIPHTCITFYDTLFNYTMVSNITGKPTVKNLIVIIINHKCKLWLLAGLNNTYNYLEHLSKGVLKV